MIDFDISTISDNISRFCYVTTVFFNTLLIYLTVCHTKQIVGTYRNMIITFGTIGICFATADILVRPLLHTYNGSFAYFTLGSTFRKSKEASESALSELIDGHTHRLIIHAPTLEPLRNDTLLVARFLDCIGVSLREGSKVGEWTVLSVVYSTSYGVIMSFLAVQFKYRACVLAKQAWTRYFDGWKLALWIIYGFANGAVWAVGALIERPDEYAYEYIGQEIMSQYGVNVRKIAVFVFLAYNVDGSLRMVTMGSLGIFTVLLSFQYTICLVCGIIMYRRTQGSMSTFSCQHEKLQKQFFKALLYQVFTPLLCFHLPSFILFVIPFFDLKISFHSTLLIHGFGIYPVLDSLILLNVVSEYRAALGKFVKALTGEWTTIFRNDGIPEPSMSVVMRTFG